jgi:hypothetical protein
MSNNGHDQHKIHDMMKYLNLNVQMLIHGNLMILLVRIKPFDLILYLSICEGTYQCHKANYEIILCPSGAPTTSGPNPTTSQPSSGNFCNGQGFDPNAYWCDGGRLCSKGEKACGSNPHSCYKESMYQCVNGQLRPK